MAEGFRFMPINKVKIRKYSVQCMEYLGATLAQVFTRAGGANVSLRDVTIAQINGARECGWRNYTGSAWRIWGIFNNDIVESELDTDTRLDDFRGSLRPKKDGRYGRCMRWGSTNGNCQNRQNVHLSPYVEEL